MASKKSTRRRKVTYPELPLLAVSVGVIFFVLELFLLFYAATAVGDLVGVFAALWVAGGIVFALGVTAMIRESRWALLLLSGPVLSLLSFACIALLSGFGYVFIDFLGG